MEKASFHFTSTEIVYMNFFKVLLFGNIQRSLSKKKKKNQHLYYIFFFLVIQMWMAPSLC